MVDGSLPGWAGIDAAGKKKTGKKKEGAEIPLPPDHLNLI
jgi:hypothetical protein